MSDTVDEGHAHKIDANNDPAIKKVWTPDHSQTFLLSSGQYEDALADVEN